MKLLAFLLLVSAASAQTPTPTPTPVPTPKPYAHPFQLSWEYPYPEWPGQDYLVQMFDEASGTWKDLSRTDAPTKTVVAYIPANRAQKIVVFARVKAKGFISAPSNVALSWEVVGPAAKLAVRPVPTPTPTPVAVAKP